MDRVFASRDEIPFSELQAIFIKELSYVPVRLCDTTEIEQARETNRRWIFYKVNGEIVTNKLYDG